MRYSTTSGMILAAIIGEAVAGPTHAHMHRHMKEKKDVDWANLDWMNMGIDWTSAWAAGQKTKTSAAVVAAATPTTTAAAAPVATTAAAVKAAATTASSGGSSGGVFAELSSDVSSLFNGLVGMSNGRTSFGSATSASGALGDNYVGNTGNPYASNIILVSDPSNYQFTNTFHNSQSKSITVNVWQKCGPDGRALSGSALAPSKTSLTFVLAPGASKTVAFQDNSQVGWAEACSKTAVSGAYATTWGEFNAVSSGSGYDVSAIMNPNGSNYDMQISSKEVTCKSTRTENMWLTDTQPIGDSNGSCYVPAGSATLTTIMGGYVS